VTNEYDRARAVFTVILGLALILLQWLSAFWTINHLQIPISRIGRDYVKLLRISDSDVSSVSANLFPNIQEEKKRGLRGRRRHLIVNPAHTCLQKGPVVRSKKRPGVCNVLHGDTFK